MNPADIRADTPALEEVMYLNTGSASVSPRSVVESVVEFQKFHEYESPAVSGEYVAANQLFSKVRNSISSFLGTQPGRIALTQSTTDGLNIVAGGLDWEKDDKLVTTNLEHPSGIIPWTRNQIGIEVLPTEDGRLDLDLLKEELKDARLLALSSISWNYGTNIPIQEIVDIAHDLETLVVVDAAQSFGQTSVDLEKWNADFVAGTGHKWLLGPWGAGILYVSDQANHKLVKHRRGSRSKASFDYTDFQFKLKKDASKLESSSFSPACFSGLKEAIDILEQIGMPTVENHIQNLSKRLKDSIPNGKLLSPMSYESGLITIDVEDPERIVNYLKSEDIVIRSIPSPNSIRVSVHVYNNKSDIDSFITKLMGIIQ